VAELTAQVSPEPSVADLSATAAAAAAAVEAAAAAPAGQLSTESSSGLPSGALAVAAAEERRLRAQTTMAMYGIRGVTGNAAEQVRRHRFLHGRVRAASSEAHDVVVEWCRGRKPGRLV
jgi:hypothetical protein